MTTVTRQALGGLAFLIAVLGAALFAPAGTFDYCDAALPRDHSLASIWASTIAASVWRT